MSAERKEIKQPKPLPVPNSDFYEFAETLSAEELAIVKKVRAYMETKVAPIINKYWAEDAFPFELLPSFKELNIAGLGLQGYGCPGGSPLLIGLVAMEIARTDTSMATLRNRVIKLTSAFLLMRASRSRIAKPLSATKINLRSGKQRARSWIICQARSVNV
jgi:alkylation response protein AidB-like acyl-CoA dehydrogenase